MGGKEIEFFLLDGNRLVKMHSDGKLKHFDFQYIRGVIEQFVSFSDTEKSTN